MKKKTVLNSNEIAKQRLESIVLNDRIQLSDEMLKNLSEEMLSVVEDYFDIVKSDSQLYVTILEKEGKKRNVLVCVTPISKVKSALNK